MGLVNQHDCACGRVRGELHTACPIYFLSATKIHYIRAIIAILFFLGICLPTSIAQRDVSTIQKHIQATPDSVENDIAKLTAYLITPAKNDLEKVEYLYQWLIQNISYDKLAYRNGNKRINRSNEDILKRKEAICWGYATLFNAMCEVANIPCEIISGYGRTSLAEKPKVKSPNHAWNSVKIDSSWYLLDATWDSNLRGSIGAFEQKFGHDYFLTPPKYFIVNHLPADPDWQLLDCPISVEEFQLSIAIITGLAERKDCEKDQEKITFEISSIHDKRLVAAIKAHQYNPTKLNERELAHAQLDYEAHLTQIAERLQLNQEYDSLLIIQASMIQLCETAAQLTELFDTQSENCAYNFFNYAVTLTQVRAEEQGSNLEKWKNVLYYLETAQNQLKDLPKNIFTEEALARCVDYIAYAKEMIDTF